MNIAIVAPIVESIPPEKYGGIELIIATLTEDLTRLGHSVTLLATGDSNTPARLVPLFPSALRRSPKALDIAWQKEMKAVALAKSVEYLAHNAFDIIHSHLDWKLLPFEKALVSPLVTTVHGPLSSPEHQPIYARYAKANFVSISLAQRQPMPRLNYVANIYNGIDPALFPYSESTDDYIVFLGRISPEKGPDLAIQAAKKAKVRLIMAAKIDPADRKFFAKEIEPNIDNAHVQFVGEVGHEQKVALLQKARALILPLQWEEPFGLTMIEAMACGTPVIVTNRGSAPEVVSHGETGFLVENSVDALTGAIRQIPAISRLACRERVEKKFSSQQMVKAYIKTYNTIINEKTPL